MKLRAPKYYKKFSCTADKCKHSCCVGWEIDIDSAAMEKYQHIKESYGKKIRESIDTSETPHFSLVAEDRCPHLDSKGLCRIITRLGEDYLCDICKEHPRFYNNTVHGKEVGLGMSCEEACRIILGSDEYDEFVELKEMEDDGANIEFDTVYLRNKIYSVISNRSLPYKERLSLIYSEYNVAPSLLSNEIWKEILSSIEYLDAAHRDLFSAYSSDISTPVKCEDILERALAYFIYRHCTSAQDQVEYRSSLGFCLFLERLLASLLKNVNLDSVESVIESARIISEEIEYSEDNTEAIKMEFAFV